MKTIESGNTNSAQWGNELIRDLAFIKRQLRYRFSKKILYGSAGWVLVLLLIVRLAAVIWVVDKSKVWGNPILWGLLIAVAILILFSVVGYIQIIKFKVIPTSFYLAENQKIIKQFLDSL